MRLCPPCDAEEKAWQSAPVLPSERRIYSCADKAEDLLQLNHDRYRDRIWAQGRLIRDHCRRHHQETT